MQVIKHFQDLKINTGGGKLITNQIIMKLFTGLLGFLITISEHFFNLLKARSQLFTLHKTLNRIGKLFLIKVLFVNKRKLNTIIFFTADCISTYLV